MTIVSLVPEPSITDSLEMKSMASWTSFSLFGSRALVASSRISIFGFLIRALAIAIRCFYPPERFKTAADPT
jgi:hypothetical protein